SGLRPRDADRQRVPLRAVRRLAVLRSRRARDGELSAPGGVELADPARDEGGCLLVAVGAEIRPAVPGGDGLAARTARGRARKRISGPSRGINNERKPGWFPLIAPLRRRCSPSGMTFGLIELPLLGHDWVAFRRRGMRPGLTG